MAFLTLEIFLLIIAFLFSLAVTFFIFRFSNKRLTKKINELYEREKEMRAEMAHILRLRKNDMRGVHAKMDSIESKLDIMLLPEGNLKELEKEKITARK